jgi:hypothetical protein
MIGGAVMTSLMLPLPADLFERQRIKSKAQGVH